MVIVVGGRSKCPSPLSVNRVTFQWRFRVKIAATKAASVFLILAVLMVGAAAPVVAQGGYDVIPISLETGERIRLNLALKPGETLTEGLLVKNMSGEPINLLIYSLDAHTSGSGEAAFPARDSVSSEMGKWLNLSDSEITLGVGESRQLEFTLSLPTDIAPGEYYGGIVVQKAEPSNLEGSERITVLQVIRRIQLVYVLVPGPLLSHLEVASVKHVWDGIDIAFEVELCNTGNVAVYPQGKLDVSEASGKLIGSFLFKSGRILAGDTLVRLVRPGGVLPEGEYRASVEVNYSCSDADVERMAKLLGDGAAVSPGLARIKTATLVVDFTISGEAVREKAKEAAEEGLVPWTEVPTAPFKLLLIVSIAAGVIIVGMAILLVVLLRRQRR